MSWTVIHNLATNGQAPSVPGSQRICTSTSCLQHRIIILNKLSTDQHVLLETVLAVSSGDLEIPKFAYTKVGLPNVAEKMWRVVNFIQKVYAPGWLLIKQNNNFLEGPRILFDILQNTRALNDQQCLDIVINKLQHWAFLLQAENFLASMLFSLR